MGRERAVGVGQEKGTGDYNKVIDISENNENHYVGRQRDSSGHLVQVIFCDLRHWVQVL